MEKRQLLQKKKAQPMSTRALNHSKPATACYRTCAHKHPAPHCSHTSSFWKNLNKNFHVFHCHLFVVLSRLKCAPSIKICAPTGHACLLGFELQELCCRRWGHQQPTQLQPQSSSQPPPAGQLCRQRTQKGSEEPHTVQLFSSFLAMTTYWKK